MPKLKYFIFICLCLLFTTCLKEKEEITIKLNRMKEGPIGRKGTLLIEASPDSQFKEDTSSQEKYILNPKFPIIMKLIVVFGNQRIFMSSVM